MEHRIIDEFGHLAELDKVFLHSSILLIVFGLFHLPWRLHPYQEMEEGRAGIAVEDIGASRFITDRPSRFRVARHGRICNQKENFYVLPSQELGALQMYAGGNRRRSANRPPLCRQVLCKRFAATQQNMTSPRTWINCHRKYPAR